MSELRLDYQHNPPFPWLGVILLGGVFIAMLFAASYHLKLSEQATSWENKLARVQDKSVLHKTVARFNEQSAEELAHEVDNANEVLRKLTVPWDDFFKAIESVGRKHATLLALEPDVEKRQVKIIGEARDYSTLMSYITLLQKQWVFESVYLQNHHIQIEDPDKPVRFALIASWRETP
jgi:hypothetical protein